MIPIVDTLLTCARQDIAVRGHRREAGVVSATGVDPTENDGIFRALLRYRIRSGDKMLQSHIESTAKNATYLSPDIQNSVLTAAGELVREKAVQRIQTAEFWSLLADETADQHHREQLTVVARYLRPDDHGHWHCYEDPIAVLDIYAAIKGDQSEDGEAKLSGKAIGDTLLQTVGKLGPSLSSCVGQGYDGAAALSSERVGAAARSTRLSLLDAALPQSKSVKGRYYTCFTPRSRHR